MQKTKNAQGGPAKGVPLFVYPKTKRAKKAAALALCVSLWIAGGSVAGATDISESTTINGNGGDYNLTGNGITFTVNGGTVGHINIPGAISGNGNTVVIDGATVTGYLDGAYITEGNATGNTVHVKNGSTVSGILHGGWGNYSANADGNTVLIEDSTVNTVCGGRRAVDNTKNTHANNNHVTIRNSYAASVIGGSNDYVYNVNAKVGTGNTVTLEGADVQAVVVGSGDSGGLEVGRGTKEYTGGYSWLVVTGLNVVRGEISNTNTIRFLPSVTWEPDKAVLVFSGHMNGGTPTLDISQANFSSATLGKMYLLYGTEENYAQNAFDAMTVKYGSGVGDKATFNGEGGVTSFVIPNLGGFQSETENGVTLDVNTVHMLALENNKKNITRAALVYRVQANVSRVALGEMTWGTARVANAEGYNFTNAAIDLSKFTFKNPETISAGTTTLLKANDTLKEIAATEKNLSYTYTPVNGVRLDGIINGSYGTTDAHALQYTATANRATKLTFGDVAWKESGALMTRPANITFAGADVDTTNINFMNIRSLEANKKMTLVSDFGNSVGTITGTKYKVGSTLEGTGKASLVGSDLIFTAETKAGGDEPDVKVQEQTHNTVMGAEAGMAALSVGNDFIGSATEGLSLSSNTGADGVSSFAKMGGGSMRQETGSHVDTHTWNAILALGHQNKKERGTFEYGAFFEYGTGNYTTHDGDERGDGSMHYTGGGLLAKWTANHGMYVEGSLRVGSVHDDARNVLRDDKGVPYSYETNAPYMGFHLGVGKEIAVAGGNAVDVYGKYFYNRRNSVSFDAGGHYDLDAVTSSVLRVGARYIMKRNKWNFYAGAAYEHEFDGKAGGTADGVAIRGADTSGASFRGELGATMKPGENSPWSLDLNVAGFAGKKQGFTGGVSVAFMF